ncbi:MAG: glycosyl hydrolase repeat-containing glycosyl hydrolase [Bryobacterales bacterium]|nr:glycosyl hydrolase repeat-containing glycosyl hydrolase [Bryobacterales bacterium]
MIGKQLGHYRVVSKIAEGGMGAVYRAHDEVLKRDVAVKVVGERGAMDQSSREYLLHEARASSALSHPNICTIHEVGEVNGELYIVMELVQGKTLAELIGSAALPVESVLRYGVQIARALAHSHDRNILHRDLKSSNIAVTLEGLVKVLDFGLARRLATEVLGEATQTFGPLDSGAGVVGTLAYMAPEVLRGEEGDYRSDLWALGVVLYEAASGQLPFRGRTTFEVTSAILHELAPPLPSWIPPGLWAVIQRCLSKEPAQRYQRASEVQAALEAVQSANITSAPAPSDQRGAHTTVHRGVPLVRVRRGDVLLFIGTTKGAFVLRSNAERARWDVGGPYFPGHAVYSMAYDSRNGLHRLWASTQSQLWGTFLRSSDDFGKTWTNPYEANLKFPANSGVSLKNIWQICIGREEDPDLLYCGVEPAALFESRSGGETWSLVSGLFDHPHRPRWVPGNGGLCLHTILPDPTNHERMYVAISAGGSYRTDDGGRTWRACNRGIRVEFMPEKYPEFGQCVHKIVMHPSRPERLFLQHHWGLYRSDDAAETWKDIGNGVASDFGFAMVVHPRDPDCVYILPVESDEFRCTPEGRLRVYRTRNAGASWQPLTRGLPQKGAYETVLRDGMTADSLDPLGIYFGTRSGQLYGSTDEGKTWKRILEGLPSVVCVKSAIIGEPRVSRKPEASRKRTVASKRGTRKRVTGKAKIRRGRK